MEKPIFTQKWKRKRQGSNINLEDSLLHLESNLFLK